ncbi:winged helix-turn-helix transcriptional regulator [Veillonella ratti]|uniref:winged helix-turn-helix transcriptional regulator n=1 Tax=Veillonella ratti TaxID=103892 RepID=UPI000F8D1C75|nr:helix-turn-helix domain-containing protein [Veillonella ratti]
MTTKNSMFQCPVEAALSLLGGKYKCIILWHLLERTHRYSELQRVIPQATPKMLTQQLRELEDAGVIERKVYPVVPPKTEYSLTEFGLTLSPIIESMCDWGKTYMGDRIVPKDCNS